MHHLQTTESIMLQPSCIKFPLSPHGLPSVDFPKSERLITGNPKRETWNLVDSNLPAGQVFSGIWRCEPGRWRIAMGPNERELFTVVSGRCRVHDACGGHEEVNPGEGLYLPPGFEGEFEVLEPLTKTYMICDASAPDVGGITTGTDTTGA